MADDGNASLDIKLTRNEKEKAHQNSAREQLYRKYPLPKNINELKSYAWGRFTWRDMIFSGSVVLVPFSIAIVLSNFLPTVVCVLFALLIAIPGLVIVNKHLFTGDLPVEEKIRISMSNAGQLDLLSWDKTKQNGVYLLNSTQSFVPAVDFSDEGFVILKDGTGGFCVIQLDVEDNTMTKYSERLDILKRFVSTLNSLIDRTSCVPIQIYLKADRQKLDGYVSNALEDTREILYKKKRVMSARASDYASMLVSLDNHVKYTYKYYIIVTYREDAEGVGDNTMNTVSVKREQMKEKANPFKKQMDAAASTDFEIGEDRRERARRAMRDSEFGWNRTNAELKKRSESLLNFLNDMGTTHTGVSAHILDRIELSKLVYESFNDVDRYVVDSVLNEAADPKDVLFNRDLYQLVPGLFKDVDDRDKMLDSISEKAFGTRVS